MMRRRRDIAGRIPFAIALVIAAAGLALAAPAQAQFFGDRFPGGRFFGGRDSFPRQPAPPHDFFSFPFFNGDRFKRPAPAPAVDSSKAPPPRKLETTPTTTVTVIGDSMADWLAYGLEETYAETPEIGVVRKVKSTAGLIRYDSHNEALDWPQAAKDMLAGDDAAAIVVMLGLNDRLPLRERAAAPPRQGRAGEQPPQNAAQVSPSPPQGQNAAAPGRPSPDAATPDTEAPAAEPPRAGAGGAFEFRTDKWDELYSKRIDEMIAALKSKGVPVFWVGLPALRGARSTGDMSYLDELFRARAEKAGVVYVDIWDGFVDDQGRFAVQGPDFEGQIRRLRTADGVFFTKAGAVKLASYVEHELRRVMQGRTAPMAMPGPEQPAPTPGDTRPVVGPVVPLTAAARGGEGELLGGGDRANPATADPVATAVLNHGDALTAPSGRADDFSWPRPAAAAAAEPNAAPVLAPNFDAVKSDAVKSDAVKSDAVKSGEVKSSAVKSGALNSDAANAEATNPDGAPKPASAAAKKATDAKTDSKTDSKPDGKAGAVGNKTAPDASPNRLRRAPSAKLDDVPRPPAPIGSGATGSH